VELVGRIPYDTAVTEAMVQGRPVTAHTNGLVSDAMCDIWERVKSRLALDT